MPPPSSSNIPPSPPFSQARPPAGGRGGPASRIEWEQQADEAYDSLTDLFLGEVGPGAPATTPQAARSAAPSSHPAPSVSPPPAPTAEPAHEGTWIDDVSADDALAVDTRRAEPRDAGGLGYDGLNDLFPEELSAPRAGASERRRAPNAAQAAHIELLVLGNLPVLGAIWATQYVRERVRREDRRIGLVRFTGSQASVEIMTPDDDPAEVFQRDPGTGHAFASLDAALTHAAGHVDEWVLRVDAADEHAAACQPGLEAITVLTSGDETARVGAFKIIKELVPLLSEQETVSTRTPSMRIVVMGAGDEQAHDAATRLAQAMQRFVARPIEAVAMAGRIRSAKAPLLLHAGKAELDAAGAIRLLHEPRRAAAAARSAPYAGGHRTPLQDRRSEPRTPEPIAEPLPAARPAAAAPAVADAELNEMPRRRPRRAAQDDALQLTAFVPGLEPLAARCPYAPAVELARDPRDGRLHMLIREGIAGENVESALGAMMTASAWADAHAAFLDGVPREGGRAGRSGAVCHLFTDRPKHLRRLLETNLRVHVLAEVRAGGGTGWYHAELN